MLLPSCAAFAQDWALINPAFKYNYSNDGTDTISHQIKVVQEEVIGADTTLLVLNRAAELCMNCWPDCDLRLGTPQFLGGSCSVSGDLWAFDEPIQRVIHSTAQLGENWVFEPENGTNASLVSIDEINVLGTVDSSRTMVSDVGDTVIWCKGLGIVRWSMHDGVLMDLIGVHGPDVGVRIPTFDEFLPYQSGDIVETLLSTWTNNSNASRWTTYTRYEIVERIEGNPGHISFNTNYISRRENYTGQCVTYSSGQTTWDFDLTDQLLSPINSSPNELVELGEPILNSWSDEYTGMQMVAEHYIDSLGHYVIESQPGEWGRIFSAVVPTDTTGCFEVWSSDWLTDGHYLIDNELGIRSRYLMTYPDHRSFTTRGAVINGDTIGVLGSDAFFHVGLIETDQTRSHVFPNPASDHLQIVDAQPGSDLIITDLHGRAVVQHRVSQSYEGVEVGSLPPGVYILRMEGYAPQRFIIAR